MLGIKLMLLGIAIIVASVPFETFTIFVGLAFALVGLFIKDKK